jgi:hypothetical protein
MRILTNKQRKKMIIGIIKLEVENLLLKNKLNHSYETLNILLGIIDNREESIEQGIIKSFQEQF